MAERSLADCFQEHADAALAAGEDKITFSIPVKSAFVVATAISQYLDEPRPRCFACDAVRDMHDTGLEAEVGALRWMLADLFIAIDNKPGLVERVKLLKPSGHMPISDELRRHINQRPSPK